MTDPRTPSPADGRTRLRGPTTMAGHVVARIAALAAAEVDGVHAVGDGPVLPAALDVLPTGRDTRVPGIRADVGTTEAVIGVRLVADHGALLPEVSDAVRRTVVDAVRTMTGLSVTAVHVEVVDVHVPAAAAPGPVAPAGDGSTG